MKNTNSVCQLQQCEMNKCENIVSESVDFLRSANGKYHFAFKLSKISSIPSEIFQSLDVRSWSQANFFRRY